MNTINGNYVLDLTAIVDESQMMFKPSSAFGYEGVAYPNQNASFTVQLSNPVQAQLQDNPATVNLVNLAAFCYNKLVTQHEFTGSTPEEFQVNNVAQYSYPAVPLVQWSDFLTTCGMFFDCLGTINYFNNYGGGQFNPQQLIIGPNNTQVGDFQLDQQALPLVARPGDSILVQYKNANSLFDYFIGQTEILQPGVRQPLYNGMYYDNNDGTFTYRALFRYYTDGNSNVVLAPVPPTNTDATNALPPLFLYIITPDQNGIGDGSANPQTQPLSLFVPALISNNKTGINILPAVKVYYTIDGSDPTTSSPFITLSQVFGSAGQYSGQVGIFDQLNLQIPPNAATTFKAKAVASGWADSPIATGHFGSFPTPGGNFDPNKNVLVGTNNFPLIGGTGDYKTLNMFYRDGNSQLCDNITMSLTPIATWTHQYRIASLPWTNYTAPFTLPANFLQKAAKVDGYANITFRTLKADSPDIYTNTGFTIQIFDPKPTFQMDSPVWVTEVVTPGSQIVTYRYAPFTQESEDNFNSIPVQFNVSLAPSDIGQDDFRYMEFKLNQLRGSATKVALFFLGFEFRQDGTLTAPTELSSTVTNTGLTWGPGDTICIHVNLFTGGFRLRINNGTWHDEMTNGMVTDPINNANYAFNWSFALYNTGVQSPFGTQIQSFFKAADFSFAIPNGAYPIGVTP